MQIVINKTAKIDDLADEMIECTAKRILDTFDVPKNSILEISLVSNAEIQGLNKEFRNIDSPTDVLSFPMDAVDGSETTISDEQPYLLGNIVIAYEVCKKQAARFNNTCDEEFTVLLTHGILHLLGHDHIYEDEAQEMQKLEHEVLSSLGLSDALQYEHKTKDVMEYE